MNERFYTPGVNFTGSFVENSGNWGVFLFEICIVDKGEILSIQFAKNRAI
jgi:hypothetical protein